jgi:hypothetical protein
MRRFISKQWWACILAIGLAVSVLPASSHASMADPGGSSLGDGGGSGGSPQIGDPDVPGTPGKFRTDYGRATSPATDISRSAGDGRQVPRMWGLRLKALLISLRMQSLGW